MSENIQYTIVPKNALDTLIAEVQQIKEILNIQKKEDRKIYITDICRILNVTDTTVQRYKNNPNNDCPVFNDGHGTAIWAFENKLKEWKLNR